MWSMSGQKRFAHMRALTRKPRRADEAINAAVAVAAAVAAQRAAALPPRRAVRPCWTCTS